MTTMSDLPGELVEEILTRVPINSLGAVRSTCNKWNVLSQNRVFGKEAARNQFLGFMMMKYRICSLRFNLHENRDEGDLVDPSIEEIGIFNRVAISKVFHCDGLLLCVLKDNSRLLVWNPYLGQTRRIKPRHKFERYDRYAIGYDKNTHVYKILRIFVFMYESGEHGFGYEIYDFSSDSWRVVNVTRNWRIYSYQQGVSLNRNTYFFCKGDGEADKTEIEEFLLCFDFTTESFGPRLRLPSYSVEEMSVSLSCVRQEKLALLCQDWELSKEVMEVWVTKKIQHNVLSWSKFMVVDMKPLTGFAFHSLPGSFFIDEDKRVVVVFDLAGNDRHETAYIFGQDGYFKSFNIGKLGNPCPDKICRPIVSSAYVPSLVKLRIGRRGKRKERDY